MVNDAARLMNDVQVVVSTLSPDVKMQKLEVRLEEIMSNYNILRKSEQDIENDLHEKISVYLSARKVEGLSDKTIKGYEVELGSFAKHVNKAVVQITTSDIRNYLGANKSWKLSTVDRKLSALKTFFGWMVMEEMLLRNPAAKIKPPKKPKRLPKGLTVEELEMIREACKTKRERAVIEVAYSTGCRLDEMLNIKKTHINEQELSISVIGKGDKERVVYLTFKSMFHLKRYLNSRDDDCEFLFVTERKPNRKMNYRTMERIVDKVTSRIGSTKRITPHTFRHTKASLMMENGASLADVQQLLGHEDPSTTQIYATVSEERKRQAHRRYHAQ